MLIHGLRALARTGVAVSSRPAWAASWRADRLLWMTTLLLAVALASGPAGAVDGWIGTPTWADYFRKNLADSIMAAGQLSKEAGKFEGRIDSARQAYWLATPDRKEAAAKTFSDLLMSKDLHFATTLVADGINAHSDAVNQMVAMLNKGHEIDGGIPPTAYGSFLAWVRGIRGSMGARNDSAIVLLDPASFNKALQANTDAYDRYRTDRDRAEANKWRSANPPPDEAVGKRPLRGPGTVINVRSVFPINAKSTHLIEQLTKASAEGVSVMRCQYGPSFDAQGTQIYISFFFWTPKAPSNLDVLMALEPKGIDFMADHVVIACPATEADALAVNRTLNKTKVSPELDALAMQWKIEEQNASPPPGHRFDPESGAKLREKILVEHPEMRARVEANVAKMQAAQERNDNITKQRACNDQYRLEVLKDPGAATDHKTQCLQPLQMPASAEATVASDPVATDRNERAAKRRACNDQYRREVPLDRTAARDHMTQCLQQLQVPASAEATVASDQVATDRNERAAKRRACNDQYRREVPLDRTAARDHMTQCLQQMR